MAEWIKTADKFPDVDRFLGISKFQRREKVHIPAPPEEE